MELNLQSGFSLFFRTFPIVLVRLAINIVVLLATIVYIGFVLFLMGLFHKVAGLIALVGFGMFLWLFRLARMYLIYLVKGAHVAVIASLLLNEKIPEGKSQFAYGKEKVLSLFKEVSVFFLLDRLVAGVIRAINSLVFAASGLLPVPGIKEITRFLQTVIKYSLTYVDEAVLSYAMVKGERNFWQSAKEGVILYFQNWKKIAVSGVKLTIMSYLFFLVIIVPLVLIYAPFTKNFSTTTNLLVFAAIIGFAFVLKAAFFDALAMTMLVVDYHLAVKDQEPSPELEAQLEKVSRKFRELKKRALEFQPGPAPSQPS